MNEVIDRRSFLKASAQGVALAGMAGSLPELFADMIDKKKNPDVWIVADIQEYTAKSPRNSLKKDDADTKWAAEKAWDTPLVGFARGNDPIFTEYKEKVGPFHWTPLEIFQLAYPGVKAQAEELAVIAWILPAQAAVKAALRKETKNPSELWVRARIYGEMFNEELRRHVAEELSAAGYPALAPTLFKDFKVQMSEKYGFASTWSERHAAYAAGLGTFGLCDGLITAKGKAMRCGAVVAKMPVTATPRPYKDHHAYCLYYAKGACGACIARCVGKAVTKAGHDKNACQRQLGVTSKYAKEHFGIDGYGCGFCQTGTPCESRIPV